MAGNLFDPLPSELAEELIEKLAGNENVTIERIVSRGHSSPSGFWYDQERSEFVVLLSGRAGLRFERQAQTMSLRPGDYVNIPAHQRHRVEWTSSDEDTVWLAVHF